MSLRRAPSVPIDVALHARLRELMAERFVTVEDLAMRIDCDPDWLEEQLPNPWVATLFEICDALGVDTPDLVDALCAKPQAVSS